ncbi:MAG: DUF1989 domain-containing protein [Gammaproteobacteria bacterium]|nr:DUF1989 domain-containing protein [Gammaproteobacteria bacterium]
MSNTTIDIPGYEGRAVNIKQGQTFRVIDVEGCQIADMFVISSDDNSEYFSPALTKQVIFRTVAKPGDHIYSNRRRPMLTFQNDTSPGPHDMSFAPCDPGFYLDLGADESHPNCLNNFQQALGSLGLSIDPAPDPFNLFQNTAPKANGDFDVGVTLSQAGDYVEFKTEMDVIVVVSACSVDLEVDGVQALGGKSTPLQIQIL